MTDDQNLAPVMHRASDGDGEIAVIKNDTKVGIVIIARDGLEYRLISRKTDEYGIFYWAELVK